MHICFSWSKGISVQVQNQKENSLKQQQQQLNPPPKSPTQLTTQDKKSVQKGHALVPS